MERELVEPSELERGRQRQPAAEELDQQRRDLRDGGGRDERE